MSCDIFFGMFFDLESKREDRLLEFIDPAWSRLVLKYIY